MSFLSNLGCVFLLGASGGVPFALGAFSERDTWGEFVFKSSKSLGGARANNLY